MAFRVCTVVAIASLFLTFSASADDWPRFRGLNGSGVSDGGPTPTTWSEDENLTWRIELPGKGASSPIVVGDRVFVTCYSGYGLDRQNPGELEDLIRHLVCVDRATGDVLWTKDVPAEMPEDSFRGAGVPAHGYASNTPVSDGERVYVFYGKSGVLAYDFDGNELWRQSVGTDSGRQRWGTAASPILVDDLVIVNASDESEALYGIDKTNGDIIWKSAASGYANNWGTPVVADVDGSKQILILVPYEVWAINPANGKLIWYAEATGDDSINTSLIPAGGTYIAMGGRGGSTVALRVGGRDDQSEDNLVWSEPHRGRIGTPVVYNDRMYWVSSNIANCVDAITGEKLYQERVDESAELLTQIQNDPSREVSQENRSNGGQDRGRQDRGGQDRGGQDGGRQFGGGGFGSSDYASTVAADGKIYATMGDGTIYVIAATTEFELLAANQFESDRSGFSATPAISNGQIFVRSNQYLYCIGEE